MPNFIEVMPLEQLPSGASTMVKIEEADVALFNIDGELYAINDTCLHQGASLAAGRVDGKVVTCRAHGFKYNLTTGLVVGSSELGVASYPVKITDGKILVAVS